MKKQKAFSLIELSIVAVVVGILIAGVIQGAGLIRASRLSDARLFTSKSPVPEIDGLVAWYETSLKTSLMEAQAVDGVQITEWYDSTPGSTVGTTKKNMLSKSASASLTYVANGINQIPSLNFTSSGIISIANFYQGASVQSTIFMVIRPLVTPSSTTQIIVDSGSATTTTVGIKNNAVRLNAGTGVDTAATNPASFSNSNDYIMNSYLNGSSSQVFVNNAESRAGNAAVNAGTNSLTGLTIGADRSSASAFTGLISEVIVYNRPLKLQERKDVMNYLSKKYKISVTGL